MYLLGYDIGSSSIKASLIDAESGSLIVSASSPATELEIMAPQPGWAEQNPETWWENVRNATAMILHKSSIDHGDIAAIGIAYQMHGLVLVDKKKKVLRPSIIWCDSRAVSYGREAFHEIGEEYCLNHYLNSPGNFTASKLKWVQENEPHIYKDIYKFMLPGEYIAMMMTGEIITTPSGLSEAILWDFKSNKPAESLMEYYDISPELVPDIHPTFSLQGQLTNAAAEHLGLKSGIPVSYRAGDQPNNALSLRVLSPGDIATTAGTSGVVYGVHDMPSFDPQSRVNPFVHVSYTDSSPRYGVLMCINGTGILNSWIRHQAIRDNLSYDQMNDLARTVPAGADRLLMLPFGNGSERTLVDRNIGGSIHNLQFNIHSSGHFIRAAQEGIVYAFQYGLEIMKGMGVNTQTVRAGDGNMFQSPVFRSAFATVTDTVLELYNTDGSQGAARGAGIGAGIYNDFDDAFAGLKATMIIEPDVQNADLYQESYHNWKSVLKSILGEE